MSLKIKESLIDLKIAFEESKFDILGIAEVRREEVNTILWKTENMLSYIGTGDGQKRIGFLEKRKRIGLSLP